MRALPLLSVLLLSVSLAAQTAAPKARASQTGPAAVHRSAIVVDTHVQRLSRRLGLTREPDPIGIEKELMPLFPQQDWALLSHLLIWHGRRTCFARKPECGRCVVNDVCPSAGVAE